MKKLTALLAVTLLLLIATARIHAFQEDPARPDASADNNPMKTTIHGYLGRPYVWGASGIKSFDCSGFVWRVFTDNGVFFKRTTARKLYMSLPKATSEETWKFGNIVFFDNLKHCGIVCSRDSFYHAESSIGTNLSQFKPYWKPKIVGVRQFPLKPTTP
jgi:cell wall-associated NlpC family hydrolase